MKAKKKEKSGRGDWQDSDTELKTNGSLRQAEQALRREDWTGLYGTTLEERWVEYAAE